MHLLPLAPEEDLGPFPYEIRSVCPGHTIIRIHRENDSARVRKLIIFPSSTEEGSMAEATLWRTPVSGMSDSCLVETAFALRCFSFCVFADSILINDGYALELEIESRAAPWAFWLGIRGEGLRVEEIR